MDEVSVGKTTNTCSLSGLFSISNLLSNFYRHIFSVPSSSVATSPQSLFNDNTEIVSVSFVDSVFGCVPSTNEVEHAVAALQSFMQRLSASISRDNNQRRQQSDVLQRVDDAFRLLQTVPSVLTMVVSISSDTAVWDAVMKNDEIQEFQRSLKRGILWRPPGFDASDNDSEYVSIMLDKMKLTLMGLINGLKSLVNYSFQPSEEKKNDEVSKIEYEELICSTLLLSTLTLMIVLVTRTYEA